MAPQLNSVFLLPKSKVMESRIPATGRHKAEQQILKMLEASPFVEITKNAIVVGLDNKVNKSSIAYAMELYCEEIEGYNDVKTPLGISIGDGTINIKKDEPTSKHEAWTTTINLKIGIEKITTTQGRKFLLATSVIDGSNGQYIPQSDLQALATLLIEYSIDNEKFKTLAPSENAKYVYLMIDKNTGYHKIGFSKDPKHREKTLQSEKPTIELLHKFEGSMSKERELHKKYDTKRIRGEWFDLNQKDIDYIKTL